MFMFRIFIILNIQNCRLFFATVGYPGTSGWCFQEKKEGDEREEETSRQDESQDGDSR